MIRFKQFIITEDSAKEVSDLWSKNMDVADISKLTGKTAKQIKAILKKAGKKGWEHINEAADDPAKMDTGDIKTANEALFDALKTTKADIDFKAVLSPIKRALEPFGITFASETKVIAETGDKIFDVSPYTNVKLVVKWVMKDNEYQLTDASLQSV